MNWSEAYKREQKMEWRDVALAIHDLVSTEQALRFYRPDLEIRHNRCPCPLHNGKDNNFSLTDYGYKCFVCGASGDVIALVKDVCELSTRTDAMKQINRDFNLRLPIDCEITQEQSTDLRHRREQAEAKKKAQEEWEQGYANLWDEWCRLDRQKRGCEVGTGAWIEAAHNIDRVSYEIDCYPEKPR